MKVFLKKQNSNEGLTRRLIVTRQTSVPSVSRVSVSSTGHALLQRKPICPCDGGCPRCAPVIQPKLIVGQPDDKYEQEADRVADQVMQMPDPVVQKKPT